MWRDDAGLPVGAVSIVQCVFVYKLVNSIFLLCVTDSLLVLVSLESLICTCL